MKFVATIIEWIVFIQKNEFLLKLKNIYALHMKNKVIVVLKPFIRKFEDAIINDSSGENIVRLKD